MIFEVRRTTKQWKTAALRGSRLHKLILEQIHAHVNRKYIVKRLSSFKTVLTSGKYLVVVVRPRDRRIKMLKQLLGGLSLVS